MILYLQAYSVHKTQVHMDCVRPGSFHMSLLLENVDYLVYAFFQETVDQTNCPPLVRDLCFYK